MCSLYVVYDIVLIKCSVFGSANMELLSEPVWQQIVERVEVQRFSLATRKDLD